MNAAKNGLFVRQAEKRDMDRLVEIHTFAFPDSRSHEARVKNFCDKPLGGFDRLRVVTDADKNILAHAFLFDSETFIGGRAVKTAAIATVGVEPASRGRGVASHLLAALHAEAKREGASLALLFAWRHGFYAKHGYVQTTPYQRLEIAAHALRHDRQSDHEHGSRVHTASGDDRTRIEAAYDLACSRSTGFLRRSRAAWDESFSDERLAWIFDRENECACAYRLVQSEPHAKVIAEVEQLFSANALAPYSIFAHLGALSDQVSEVHLPLPWNDPLALSIIDGDAHRFGDATVEHSFGRVCGGPMIHALDIPALLAARGYANEGATTIEIDHARFNIVARDGRATVSRARDGIEIDVKFQANAAAVIAGGVSLEHAITLGWARATNLTSLARASTLLATPPFFTLDSF